ncbi:MAG: substrate-binding domain-containing protein, partial [Demequina sp.]|uniref:substrate-binding domain-containing protein n=1 Tax=Demequina sp. TaxID=2050685 RepID=UPI003A85B96E
GFDDIPEAGLASPALTTVRQAVLELGASAMRMLLDRIVGREHASLVRLETSLVLRETCAPPRP